MRCFTSVSQVRGNGCGVVLEAWGWAVWWLTDDKPGHLEREEEGGAAEEQQEARRLARPAAHEQQPVHARHHSVGKQASNPVDE